MKTPDNDLLTGSPKSRTLTSIDERLTQQVIQAQKADPQSQERQLILICLVDEILRSRRVARSPVSQPLFGVYKDIYERVRQQILQYLNEELDDYNPIHLPIRIWVNNLRDRAFQKILNNEQLKKMALEAQKHPLHSELHKYALGELVEAIQLSGKLAHPHQIRFSSPQFYKLIYEEAVNKTLTYICRKIHTYDPERGDKKFMNWVNFRLDRNIIELYHEFNNPNISQLPEISNLERIVQPEKSPSLFEIILERIEEDADNSFQKTSIRNRPDANFQAIALARLSGKTWEEISSIFKISVSTLSVFFLRCCQKFHFNFRH